MSLEGAKKLSLSETEPKAKRARNDQQKKQGKTLRTWVASRWTSGRFSMLSYVPNHFPILYDSVSKTGTDPVTVFAPVPRFWNAPYTTLDRSEALILRRFRGGRTEGWGMKRGRYDIGARCGATVLRFWDFVVIHVVIVATLKQPLYPPGWG